MRYHRLFWQGLLWANWAAIIVFWLNGSGAMLGGSLASLLIASGRLAGLAAAYMILLQFFFMGRMPWLERVFGLDKLSQIHHTNGKWGLVLLLLHPILLVAGYRMFTGLSPIAQYVSFLTSYKHVIWAALGTALFLTVVLTSIHIVRSRLRYESWYAVHLAAYLAVFASFWHQIRIGEDLLASQIFYGYWIALYTAVFSSHLVFRFLRPLYRSWRHNFRVMRVVRESPSTVSLYLTGQNLAAFPIRPGQFMILRFFTKKLWWQAHPFSLSMIPDGRELRITVKELGDFTRQVKDIAPNTRVFIDGPYGVFTDLFSISSQALMIAGGIGITPIRSLMEAMLQKGKSVALLYGNRTEGDIIFRKELEAIATRYHAPVTHIISDDPQYEGEKGRIDADKIRRLVPDFVKRDIYLCGPPPMMDGLLKILASLGVPKQHIHYERFSL